MLRGLKKERGSLALALARDDAIVFGDAEGKHRHPERFGRSFKDTLTRCQKQLAEKELDAPEMIRLHDLRHTHATLQLVDGTIMREVSERYHEAIPGPDMTMPRACDLLGLGAVPVSEGGLEPPCPLEGTSTSS
jgi:integrase